MMQFRPDAENPLADGNDEPVNVNRRRVLQRIATASVAIAGSAVASEAASPAAKAEEAGVLDVLIIGSGLAGLTAARDLERAGNRRFIVLEARDRVGGRTLNHRLRDGYISEAGGQWMGPGQTAVADLARELGVATFKSDYTGMGVFRMGKGSVATDSNGSVDLDPQTIAKFEELARSLPPRRPWLDPKTVQLDRMSVADWLAANKVGAQDMLTWQFASILTLGSSLSNVSLLYYLSYVNCAGSYQGLEGQNGGAQETRFHGGSQILSVRMAAELGERVRLSCPVLKIVDWDKPVVEVHTAQSVFRARRVIVALSPPLCNRLHYDPPLPADRQELQRRWPAHAPQAKSAMVYSSPFWFKKGFNGQVAGVSGPVIWSFDNSPPDKKLGVINAFMRVSELPADHSAAQRKIAGIYAEAFRDERFLDPLEFHVHDWGQEPYTLTCISPMPPGFLSSGLMPALNRNVGALIWSGTETADIWYGYMDGAVRSGHRAALEALQALQSSRGGRT